jgi:N-acetylneuraminate synthase
MEGLRRPYLVAEIGSNHLGSIDRALALIDAAAPEGAD